MRFRETRGTAAGLMVVLCVCVLCGCASNGSMAEAKKMAYDRWSSARSGILYSVALQQFETGDLSKSYRSCQEGVSASPNSAMFFELLGRIAIERNELEKAHQYFSRAVELEPNREMSHYLMGVVYQRWQEYELALSAYEKAYGASLDKVDGLLALTEMLVKLGRVKEAVTRLESKLVYFGHNAEIRVVVGCLHMMQGEYGRAVSMYREAELLVPDDGNVLEYLVVACIADGEHENAADNLERLLERDGYEERSDLWIMLGDCYQSMGRLKAASELYEKVTRVEPGNVDGWIKRGQLAWIMHDDRLLSSAGGRVVSLSPDRFEGYLLRGMSNRRAGRTERALSAFDRAKELSLGNVLPLIMKGMVFEDKGDVASARESYEAALEVEPGDERATRLLIGLGVDE